ncbi:MAG TPA: sigma-70 family RNA polymerase sigma factor [Planctomycetota bacterium]|nr:sigma-70 family RNA polymerase sigma factor [Planctomycetota bacterium]
MIASGSRDSEAFVRLMTGHQGRLFGYLFTLLGDPDAANDVLQETNVVLWRDCREFRPGSNFKAWAFRVAHFQVMAFRQRQIRDRLVFEDEMLEVLASAARETDDAFAARQEKLTDCLGRLAAPHRELIRRRYTDGESLEAIARGRDMTPNAVMQSLFRIRHSLMQCVARFAGGDA